MSIINMKSQLPNAALQSKIAEQLERIANIQEMNKSTSLFDNYVVTMLDGTKEKYEAVQRAWLLANGADTADAATFVDGYGCRPGRLCRESVICDYLRQLDAGRERLATDHRYQGRKRRL